MLTFSRVRRPPCDNRKYRGMKKNMGLHFPFIPRRRRRGMAGLDMSRHCGINGRGPAQAGRETVYAAKGLYMSSQTDEWYEEMCYYTDTTKSLHAKMRSIFTFLAKGYNNLSFRLQ
jgi:hypothetical protein